MGKSDETEATAPRYEYEDAHSGRSSVFVSDDGRRYYPDHLVPPRAGCAFSGDRVFTDEKKASSVTVSSFNTTGLAARQEVYALRRAISIQQCCYPGVIPLFFQQEGRVRIVSKPGPSGSLRLDQFLAKKKFSELEILLLLEKIVVELKRIHSCGIANLAIRPENILVLFDSATQKVKGVRFEGFRQSGLRMVDRVFISREQVGNNIPPELQEKDPYQPLLRPLRGYAYGEGKCSIAEIFYRFDTLSRESSPKCAFYSAFTIQKKVDPIKFLSEGRNQKTFSVNEQRVLAYMWHLATGLGVRVWGWDEEENTLKFVEGHSHQPAQALDVGPCDFCLGSDALFELDWGDSAPHDGAQVRCPLPVSSSADVFSLGVMIRDIYLTSGLVLPPKLDKWVRDAQSEYPKGRQPLGGLSKVLFLDVLQSWGLTSFFHKSGAAREAALLAGCVLPRSVRGSSASFLGNGCDTNKKAAFEGRLFRAPTLTS